MSNESHYRYRVTNRTASANASTKRLGAGPRHYINNPGPRERLAAAAGPGRATRVPNANIAWEPAFRGPDAQQIWSNAKGNTAGRSDEVDRNESPGHRLSSAGGPGSTSNSAPVNFAGALDNLDGSTRVDMFGVPVAAQEDPDGLQEQRTSEGKTQVDYLRQFQERNLAPGYSHLIIAFRHAPPVDLRDFCSSCVRRSHWNNPFHFVGWWTGQHYCKAWLQDAGVAIHLCPNAPPGESCPQNPGRQVAFDEKDAEPPPSYGSFSWDSQSDRHAAVSDPVANDPLTGALRPDERVHLPPEFGDIDEGETEDVVLTAGPDGDDEYQPIGSQDDGYDGPHSQDQFSPGVAREGSQSSIPTRDWYGYRTLVVTHTDGIHGIGVGFCRCQGAPPEDHQLIKYGGLFPASPDTPSSAFTLQFLEYRHVDDVICKTTPQAHMRKIRRCTEPDELRLAPNRYPELLLVSRLYTAIKNLIDFGFASRPLQDWRDPPPGGLVWKCIVCPRKTPDFNNLPKVWQTDPEEWRKFVSLCYDGNFSGDHTISWRPGNNVPLFPGTGMFGHPDAIAAYEVKSLDDRALRQIYPNLGVGVWHIYGHALDCFRRFSPSYSPRAGIVDGEILETLWSLLNGILQSCRGMSLAAREEKINMHMNDINYRKIVEMVGTLVRKYRKYTTELRVRRRHLSRLELSCSDEDIERWELARRDLEEKRVKDPRFADKFWDSPFTSAEPGKEITKVRLLEDDKDGLVKAIIESLKLEEDSLRIQAQGKDWGSSVDDRRTAAIARTRFDNRRSRANRQLASLLDVDVQDEDLLPAKLARLLDEDEWSDDINTAHHHHLRPKPEFRPVALPSGWPSMQREKGRLSEQGRRAMDFEIELRVADMIERLQATREGLCDQAQGYRLAIRNKKGKGSANYRDRTNAWIHARQQTKDVRVHAAIYNHHLRRLQLCFWDDTPQALARYATLRQRYKPILAEHIRCSTATYEMYNDVRTRGNFALPWFWRMQHAISTSDTGSPGGGDHSVDDDETFIGNFFRTRWINAKCAVVRCEEEEFMLQGEMQTCYLGYLSLAYSWRRRGRLLPIAEGSADEFAGLRAHALQNMHAWLDLAAHARQSFNAEVSDIITDELQ
ncbi:unnamed protein product [Peniophora sp. CBMAI 1063]|nr:unnamed protein product [Peniophora sp. CBMAI 1063]